MTPRVVATADTYEVSLRRRTTSSERADVLLLKEALRKSLLKDDVSQGMGLRGVTYSPVSQCEGYRVVGLTVRRENVSFSPLPVSVLLPAALAPAPAAPAPAPAAVAQAQPMPATATPAASDEATDRLFELWQARQATTAQLRTLHLRMNLDGEFALARQLVDEIAASMRQRDLSPAQLPPRGLSLPATLAPSKASSERSLD